MPDTKKAPAGRTGAIEKIEKVDGTETSIHKKNDSDNKQVDIDFFKARKKASEIKAAIQDRSKSNTKKPETKKEKKLHNTAIADEIQTENELTPGGRPQIHAGSADIAAQASDSWAALELANNPPRLFTYAGQPVRMNIEGEIQPLTQDRMLFELERAAFWFHLGTGKFSGMKIKARAPRAVVQDMLAAPETPLPTLRRISAAPCFDEDGVLCASPGFHASGIFIIGKNAELKTLPLREAIGIIEDIFLDFPFQDQADRANAYAFLLTPFCRDMIQGPVPAAMIEAQIQGTGKTLFCEIVMDISTGGRFEQTAPSGDEDELRKRITSLQMAGASAVVIDNCETINSGTLASAITAARWTDRVLGKSEMVSIPNNAVFALTGNNIALSGEIARRVIRIRLQSKTAAPWERKEFRHPKIKTYVQENRARLQSACISIVQTWIDAGKPLADVEGFGSFESYTEIIGSILHHTGIEGFLQNRRALFEEADSESETWKSFVYEWYQRHGPTVVTSADLWPMAADADGLGLPGNSDRARRTAFGMKLQKYRDRIFGEYQITKAGTRHKSAAWKLQKVQNIQNKGGTLGTFGTSYTPSPIENKNIQGGNRSP